MPVQPLPYHRSLLDYLRKMEPELWEWFSSDDNKKKSTDALRLELLKATYRLPEQEHTRLYELGREAAQRLEIDVPLTFYQAVDYGVMNAGLSRFPDEAHLVLCGPVQDKLNDEQLIALFGHELSHLKLWSGWNGDYLVVDELVAAMANEENASESYATTERLFHLYTEIFCDRGALQAANGDCLAVIAVLIRLETSLDTIRPESFLEQVDEIIDDQQVRTEGLTHPEAYIRAKAVQLWAEHLDSTANADKPPILEPPAMSDAARVDEQIARMLEGPAELERLDLVGRGRIESITRKLLNRLLQPEWMRTETNLNHAKLFFTDYVHDADDVLQSLDKTQYAESVLLYLCYVMLDFATSDRGLEDAPLAQAIETAKQLDLESKLAPLAQKELRIRKRQYAEASKQAASVLKTVAIKDEDEEL